MAKKLLIVIIIYLIIIFSNCTVACTAAQNDISTQTKNSMLQMTTTLENSNTQLQLNYAENIYDGRGITFGCIGFCTGTYDGNILIHYYTTLNPTNPRAKYIPALDSIDAGPHNSASGDGNPDTTGLDGFIQDVQNDNDPLFKQAQLYELDQMYYNPAIAMFNSIGAQYPLTLALIYDMSVRHGTDGAQNIIDKTTSTCGGTPGSGVNEITYLNQMLSNRDTTLKSEGLGDTDRDTGFKAVLNSGNVNLVTPFTFTAYGDLFTIDGVLDTENTGQVNPPVAPVTPVDPQVPINVILPVANLTSNVTSGYAPLDVQFTDFSENTASWLWDFGDGNNSTAQSTEYVYTAPGSYMVNLTVSNMNGIDYKLIMIHVLDNNTAVNAPDSNDVQYDHNYTPGHYRGIHTPGKHHARKHHHHMRVNRWNNDHGQ
jgi:chitosanase